MTVHVASHTGRNKTCCRHNRGVRCYCADEDQCGFGCSETDGDVVYFADAGRYYDDLPPPKPNDVPGFIASVARDGGPVTVVSVEGRNVGRLAQDECQLYWASERGLVRMRKP